MSNSLGLSELLHKFLEMSSAYVPLGHRKQNTQREWHQGLANHSVPCVLEFKGQLNLEEKLQEKQRLKQIQ